MLMPSTNTFNSIFGESFFDDFMKFPFGGYRVNNLMNTDIRDTEQGYEVVIDMPGIKKEDVRAELENGYLTINASSNMDNDEKKADGTYIRRERYSGSYSRSFYVGENVKEEDIKARFEDGTLKLLIPKKEEQPAVEQKKCIAIEG